ncbi:MAG: toll/interleukin-1 receptor domain-containing protein [Anaerolineae bacterium]|jgi:hypothetical protein|nr:toll/interleukin-1 receptor domain-containing protein [Anaerolineae bacterium]
MLPDDLIPRATQVLLPRWATPDERSAWLAQAFFLTEPRLYNQLRALDGQPIIILTQTITALLEAGCLPNRKAHSLAQLLNSVRIIAPPEAQTEIDRLVPALNTTCAEASPTSTGTFNTVDGTTTRPAQPLQSYETPLEERTPTVFISYSHDDDSFALRLINDLQNGGHAVWIDKMSIKGGAEWVRSIADGIRNSYAFVTILSPTANTSRWVLREYLLADNLGKPIFPVMAAETDVPLQMIDRQVIMMFSAYADGLTQLLGTLPAPRAYIPPPDVPRMAVPAFEAALEADEEASLDGFGGLDLRKSAPAEAEKSDKKSEIAPPPRPVTAPPKPVIVLPTQPMPARKSSGAVRGVLALVGVLVVGAVGLTLFISGLGSRAPFNPQSLTEVAVGPTAPGEVGVRPTMTAPTDAGDEPTVTEEVGGNTAWFGLALLGLAAAATAFYILRVYPRPATTGAPSREAAPDEVIVPPPPPMPKPAVTMPAAPAPQAPFGGVMPSEPTADRGRYREEARASAAPLDRRALELAYINRVAAERINAMAEMGNPTPDDRVRVMALSADLPTRAEAWTQIEPQTPKASSRTVLDQRRAALMGDERSDSMGVLWEVADILTQRAMTDPTQPIPLVIDFTRWEMGIGLADFIDQELGELSAYRAELLAGGRAALLFDGLHTLSTDRLREVEAFIAAHPTLMAVVDLTGV